MIEVRIAEEADAVYLATLETVCFPHDAWNAATLHAYITDADCPTLVATDGGSAVGYVTGRVMPPEAELYRICIHPDMRRCGTGGALLAAFHNALRMRGCDTCYLEVRDGNHAARTLYRKHGYEACGRRKKYYHAPDEDAVVKVKKL